jgi:hypothetical protein
MNTNLEVQKGKERIILPQIVRKRSQKFDRLVLDVLPILCTTLLKQLVTAYKLIVNLGNIHFHICGVCVETLKSCEFTETKYKAILVLGRQSSYSS